MASASNSSLDNDRVVSADGCDEHVSKHLTPPRTTVCTTSNRAGEAQSFDIDNISTIASPSGHLSIEGNDKGSQYIGDMSNDDDDVAVILQQDRTWNAILAEERQNEVLHLTQSVLSQHPKNDATAHFIMNQLNLLVDREEETTVLSSIATDATEHPYPPMNQTGTVADHDRPYADYGHLNRETIAEECQFNLERPLLTQRSIRLNAKSFSITSWTEVSKEIVFDQIKQEFGIQNIQYICISEEISELNHQRHLHIQIILKEKVDRRKPFLDDITGTRCNYQVTQNDVAWNEYIKKDGNYIEFNEFKSTRIRGKKEWPSESASNSQTSDNHDRQLVPRSTSVVASTASSSTTTTTVRAQIQARRQFEQETVVKALKLAETNVHQAMDLIRHSLPIKFLSQSTWYLSTFNYVHLRSQAEADRNGQIEKEYVWPLSFPHCTEQLRQAMKRWIQHHFSRTKRAKCLIIIGPTGTGKTSFALSLPGRVNYFKERWNLDNWSDYARYSVYDDIPWDDFSKLNYPNKKGLLTQNGKINATDKYRGTKEINVRQPAIVLLNPEDAGSLLVEPVTQQEHQIAMYWKQRAFIYIMTDDEYFYQQPKSYDQADDDEQLSNHSSMHSNDAKLGEPDEFDQMIERYQQKHPQS